MIDPGKTALEACAQAFADTDATPQSGAFLHAIVGML
jgi:hypothetical protein